jgi:RNA polymerase sigma-70 factor (ECF subfamily)
VSYAYLFAMNRAEAEDLVQEALVRTFSRRRSFHDPASAEGYVRQAIRTSFMDAARRGGRWRARLHLVAESETARSPEDTAADGLDVRAALAGLPPQERACVVLRHMDDLTVADIAAELGLRPGTVKRYLSDGTRTLRGAVGDSVDWPAENLTTIPVHDSGRSRS